MGAYLSMGMDMTVLRSLQMDMVMGNEIKHPTSASSLTFRATGVTFPLKDESRNPSYPTIQLHDDFPENRIASSSIRRDSHRRERILMVGKVVRIHRFSREIRNRQNKLIAVHMREILRCLLRSNFPHHISPPTKHKPCPLSNNHIWIA